MPRDGSGVYAPPAGTTATAGTAIESAKYNAFVNDIAADSNTARPISAGGTGATTAAGARAALGAQASSPALTSIAALTTATDRGIYTTAADTYATFVLTAAGRAILDDADAAAQRATLGAQASDADLNAIAALASTGIAVRTAADTWATRTITSSDGSVTITNPGGVAGNIDLSASRGRVLLATKTASASATLDFTEFNNATYRRYEFELENVKPATDSTILYMRTSTDGGSTYDAGASDYTWGINGTTAGSTTSAASAGDSALVLGHNTLGFGNAAAEYGGSGTVELIGAPSATVYTEAIWELNYWRDSGVQSRVTGGGARLSAADVDAVRFLFSSGNIASGTIRMFGII